MPSPAIPCRIPRAAVRLAIQQACEAHGIHRKNFRIYDIQAAHEAAEKAAGDAILLTVIRSIKSTTTYERDTRRKNLHTGAKGSRTRKAATNREQGQSQDLFSAG